MFDFFLQKEKQIQQGNPVSPAGSLVLSALSGVLFLLAYPSFNYYGLAWVFLIPLLFAVQHASLSRSYISGLITGTIIVTGGMHWQSHMALHFMSWPSPLHYLFPLLYGMAIGQVLGLIMTAWQWVRTRTQFHDLLTLPVLFTAFWSLYPMVFYFRLGGSQSYFLTAIQAIEFTGIYGLDFIIVLFNLLLFKLLTEFKTITRDSLFYGASVLLVLWFVWGVVSLSSWNQKILNWESKKIGIVQPNRTADLGKKQPDPGFSYQWPKEMEMTSQLVAEGAKTIIWPEGHFYGFAYWHSVRSAFIKQVQEWKVDLLFQDTTFDQEGERRKYHNSAIMLFQDGRKPAVYHKNILVPFGEYIPFVRDFPWLEALLHLDFVQLYPGENAESFEGSEVRITPLICYESIFPEFAAKSLMNDPAGKIFAVGSQDGWYGIRKAVEQHNASTVLRAVENRVPLVHVVYNGFSSAVLPTGEYVFQSPYLKEGAWAFDLPYNKDSGGSWYTKHPGLFINAVRLLGLLILITVLMNRKKR